jgi:hypothetical protein
MKYDSGNCLGHVNEWRTGDLIGSPEFSNDTDLRFLLQACWSDEVEAMPLLICLPDPHLAMLATRHQLLDIHFFDIKKAKLMPVMF